MKTKLSIILGSALGACAIHLVLTACGTGHGQTSTANAQTVPTCTAWQTSFYAYEVQASYSTIPDNQVLGVQATPAGWEPVNVQPVGGSDTTIQLLASLRKCVSQ